MIDPDEREQAERGDAPLEHQPLRPQPRRPALHHGEDGEAAERERRPFERVQALLTVENVLGVQTQGIDRAQKDLILSLLDITYDGPAEGPGRLTLTLAGDGAIALQVEALELFLRDTTRPYRAVAGKAPDHG